MQIIKLSDALLEGMTLQDPSDALAVIKAAETCPLELYKATHLLDTGKKRYLMRDLTGSETRTLAKVYKSQLKPRPQLDPPDGWKFKMQYVKPGREYTKDPETNGFDKVPSDPLYWLFAQNLGEGTQQVTN